jgi:hypothetical protein
MVNGPRLIAEDTENEPARRTSDGQARRINSHESDDDFHLAQLEWNRFGVLRR